MIVGLHLHEDVGQVRVEGVASRARVREEARDPATLHDRRVVGVGADGALGVDPLRLADHLEEGLGHGLTVDDPGRVEDLVAAVLRVRLGEHRELDVGGVPPVLPEVLEEVVGLVGGQGEPHGLVGLGDGLEAAPENVDLLERPGLEVVEELVRLFDRGHHRLGHPVVEERQGRGDLRGLAVEVEGGAALHAPHDVEAALPGDVGGLGGPGGDGPQAGDHQEHPLAQGPGWRGLGPVGEEPVEGLLLCRGRLPLDLHEVPELGGGDVQPGADRPDRGVELLEAEVREGGAPGELEDGHRPILYRGPGGPGCRPSA